MNAQIKAIGVAGDSKREEYRQRLAAIEELADLLPEEAQPVLTAGIRLGDCARFCAELDDISHILADYHQHSWQNGKTMIAERVAEIKASMDRLHVQLGDQLKAAADKLDEEHG